MAIPSFTSAVIFYILIIIIIIIIIIKCQIKLLSVVVVKRLPRWGKLRVKHMSNQYVTDAGRST